MHVRTAMRANCHRSMMNCIAAGAIAALTCTGAMAGHAAPPASPSTDPPSDALPPLTPTQQVELDAARDGDDFREPAFLALIEHTQSWPPDLPARAALPPPDGDALLADPARHRGEPVMLEGRIEQQMRIDAPYGPAVEYFLRDANDQPLIVYTPAARGADATALRDGQRVQLPARFYKTMQFTARDGRERTYLAFVGNHPGVVQAAGPIAWSTPAVIALAVLILFVVFLVLFAIVRSQRRSTDHSRRRPPARPDAPPDDDAPLPDEPVEALAELHRRAHSTRP